jgi:SNF2 family DNA or RNA helicase
MTKLEDLAPNAAVRGVLPDALVTVVNVKWFGSSALEPVEFRRRRRLFRLVSEAHRIKLAHLFDPVLAVHTSVIDPYPHQITAVYESMLPRQPLRFLLADDPGAGKTIMAGLLIKELIARGDLQRCLVVCPGSLAEQWQDELYRSSTCPSRS